MPALDYSTLPLPKHSLRLLPVVALTFGLASLVFIFVPFTLRYGVVVVPAGPWLGFGLAALAVLFSIAELCREFFARNRPRNHAIALLALCAGGATLLCHQKTWTTGLGLVTSEGELQRARSTFRISNRWSIGGAYHVVKARDKYADAWFLFQIPPSEIEQYEADVRRHLATEFKYQKQGHSVNQAPFASRPGWWAPEGDAKTLYLRQTAEGGIGRWYTFSKSGRIYVYCWSN